MNKTYLSNIRPAWPFERQEAVLDASLTDWREGSIYRDTLSARKRMSHGPADMRQRAAMLRPTRRQPSGETVTVSTLAVLDWTAKGLLAVLTALSERNATLVSLDCGSVVPPNDVAAATQAVTEFERAIRRVGDARKSGGMVSGERRSARSKAACAAMKPYWGMPSDEYPTAGLLSRFDVSRPTAIAYLGPRGDAQRAHEHAREAGERNRKRAEGRSQHAEESA